MADKIPITPQGLSNIKKEIKHLKSVERPKNIKDIETARAHGDLSENAEFSAAKERQSHLEGKILELENVLVRAEVIDPSQLSHDRVVFGATVTLSETDTGQEKIYQIVGAYESDVNQGRLSVLSPLAKSLIGKRVDDLVKLQTIKGVKEYELLKIEFK